MSEHIDVNIADGVLTMRMNRPEKKNALTDEMYHALADAMEAAYEDDAVGAILLCGGGDDFSTGNDVGDFLKVATGQVDRSNPGVWRFLAAQIDTPKPLVCAVKGLAVGVGATTLFQADLVYAADNASIRTPFLDLGVVPENASSYLAPRIMGYQRAFELLCLGEPFSAQRGYEAGFVNRVCPVEDVENVALDAAKRLAAKPPQALRMSRDLMRGDLAPRRAASAEESRLFGERLTSDEARMAFMAFMNRKRG